LTAWFREKYPNSVIGAVASSATIAPKVDFYGEFTVFLILKILF
jgi:hypothetical protein